MWTLSLPVAGSLKLLVDIGTRICFVIESPVKLKSAPPTGHAGLNVARRVLILTIFFIVLSSHKAQILARAFQLDPKLLFYFLFGFDHFYPFLRR